MSILLAYLIILTPLIAYLAAFSYETVLSCARLSRSYQRSHRYQGYAHATWEITHTLLIFSFTGFFVLFSPLAEQLSERAYVPLFLAGALFAIRGVIYLYMFYVVDDKKTRPFWDWLFALSHVSLLAALVWAVFTVVKLVIDVPTTPLVELLPIVAPPIVLVLIISAIPLLRLYFTSNTNKS